jgi:hypothetical protein
VHQCGFIAGIENQRLFGNSRAGHGHSRLHRGATSRPPDQTNLECSRPDAALAHHNRRVKQSC